MKKNSLFILILFSTSLFLGFSIANSSAIDAYETNDGFDDASDLSPSVYPHAVSSLDIGGPNYEDEYDYFNITVAAGNILNVNITSSGSLSSAGLRIYDTDQSLLDYFIDDDGYWSFLELQVSISTTGEYTIRINCDSNTEVEYTMIIDVYTNPLAPDTYEENDDFDEAKTITTGSYSDLSIGEDDNYDFYNVTVGAGYTISVTATFPESLSYNLWLTLYNPDQTEVDVEGSDSESVAISYFTFESGIYTIEIYTGDETVYDFTVEISSEDAEEDCDDFDNAAPMLEGDYDLTIGDDDNADYYYVYLSAGDSCMITLEEIAGNDNVEIEIIGFDETTEIDANRTAPTSEKTVFIFSDESPGIFYIVITVDSPTGNNLYNLDIFILEATCGCSTWDTWVWRTAASEESEDAPVINMFDVTEIDDSTGMEIVYGTWTTYYCCNGSTVEIEETICPLIIGCDGIESLKLGTYTREKVEVGYTTIHCIVIENVDSKIWYDEFTGAYVKWTIDGEVVLELVSTSYESDLSEFCVENDDNDDDDDDGSSGGESGDGVPGYPPLMFAMFSIVAIIGIIKKQK